MYLFSPSTYVSNAIFAVRFGSYSILATFAGILSLFLLKSLILYFLVCAPPLCLTVIFPCAFLPEFFLIVASNDFSGVVYLRQLRKICLLDGVYGLYFLTPTVFSSLFVNFISQITLYLCYPVLMLLLLSFFCLSCLLFSLFFLSFHLL